MSEEKTEKHRITWDRLTELISPYGAKLDKGCLGWDSDSYDFTDVHYILPINDDLMPERDQHQHRTLLSQAERGKVMYASDALLLLAYEEKIPWGEYTITK
jgi:hypothetical protein